MTYLDIQEMRFRDSTKPGFFYFIIFLDFVIKQPICEQPTPPNLLTTFARQTSKIFLRLIWISRIVPNAVLFCLNYGFYFYSYKEKHLNKVVAYSFRGLIYYHGGEHGV